MILLEVGVHEDNKSRENVRPFGSLAALNGLPQLRPFDLIQVLGLVESLEGVQGVEIDHDTLSRISVPAEGPDLSCL